MEADKLEAAEWAKAAIEEAKKIRIEQEKLNAIEEAKKQTQNRPPSNRQLRLTKEEEQEQAETAEEINAVANSNINVIGCKRMATMCCSVRRQDKTLQPKARASPAEVAKAKVAKTS